MTGHPFILIFLNKHFPKKNAKINERILNLVCKLNYYYYYLLLLLLFLLLLLLSLLLLYFIFTLGI